MEEDTSSESTTTQPSAAAAESSPKLKLKTRISIKRDDKLRRLIKKKSERKSAPVLTDSSEASEDEGPALQAANRSSAPADVMYPSANHKEVSESRDSEKTKDEPQPKEPLTSDIVKENTEETSEINKKLYSWGSTFASVMGAVGKIALDGAVTVMKSTLQYVPEYHGDLSDSDGSDEDAIDQWHDANFSDSSPESENEFEDAVEQIQVGLL